MSDDLRRVLDLLVADVDETVSPDAVAKAAAARRRSRARLVVASVAVVVLTAAGIVLPILVASRSASVADRIPKLPPLPTVPGIPSDHGYDVAPLESLLPNFVSDPTHIASLPDCEPDQISASATTQKVPGVFNEVVGVITLRASGHCAVEVASGPTGLRAGGRSMRTAGVVLQTAGRLAAGNAILSLNDQPVVTYGFLLSGGQNTRAQSIVIPVRFGAMTRSIAAPLHGPQPGSVEEFNSELPFAYAGYLIDGVEAAPGEPAQVPPADYSKLELSAQIAYGSPQPGSSGIQLTLSNPTSKPVRLSLVPTYAVSVTISSRGSIDNSTVSKPLPVTAGYVIRAHQRLRLLIPANALDLGSNSRSFGAGKKLKVVAGIAGVPEATAATTLPSSSQSVTSQKDIAVATGIASHEFQKFGGALTGASFTVRSGSVTDGNTRHSCTSGQLLNVRLVGSFDTVTTFGLAVQPGATSEPAQPGVDVVNATADASTGRICLVSVGTGTVQPDPRATPLDLATIRGGNHEGSIAGVDEVCAGPAYEPPRPATIRVRHGRTAVATVHVIAGKSGQDTYRISVPAGKYFVVASNWGGRRTQVRVRPGEHVRSSFLNDCD